MIKEAGWSDAATIQRDISVPQGYSSLEPPEGTSPAGNFTLIL